MSASGGDGGGMAAVCCGGIGGDGIVGI